MVTKQDVSSKQDQKASSPGLFTAPAQNALNNMLPDMLQSMAQVQGAAVSAFTKCNLELLEFVKTRFEEDRKLASSLRTSQDATELFEHCSEFWRKAIADYSSEANKLAVLNTRLAGELAEKTGAAAQAVIETHPDNPDQGSGSTPSAQPQAA